MTTLPEQTRVGPAPAAERLLKPGDKWITDRIGFRETTVRRLVREGLLRGCVVCGQLRIPESAIDEFIARAKRGEVA